MIVAAPESGLDASPEPPPEVRRNTLLLGGDMAVFFLALAFASPQTLIPAFAERLGASNLVIGAIPALMTVGWMLPSIFAANYTQGLSRKLPFILRWTILERLPYLVLGLAALWVAPSSPELTLLLLLVMLSLMTITGGLLMPAWLDLIGRVVPVTLRGRFFALSISGGTLLGLAGAGGVGWVLDRYGFPLGYGICFLVGFAWMVVSFVFIALVREPPSAIPARRLPTTEYLRRLPTIVRANPNLARFLGARALVTAGGMAGGFYTVYALKDLGASDREVGVFTLLLLLAQLLGTLGFGWLADRRGHLLVLTLGSAASGLGSLAAVAAFGVVALYPAFLFSGLALAATQVSGMPIGLELGPEDERPTYVAINNSSIAPFALAAPLLGGALADQAGFTPVFVIAAGLSVAGALAFWRGVRDPRQGTSDVSDTLRST